MEAINEIIDRAVKDEVFRKLLFTDPSHALEGYQLNVDERTMLEGLTEDSFNEFAGSLGDRTTKGTWILGG